MGLDISAYGGMAMAPAARCDGDGYPIDPSHVLIHPSVIEFTEGHWPGRAGDLKAGVYTCAHMEGFRAGSYSGYGRWREWLARRAGYGSALQVWTQKPSGPFVELIDFADNEGVIAGEVAAKLARDFAENEERILAGEADGHFIRLYRLWRSAFELAADRGAVVFH